MPYDFQSSRLGQSRHFSEKTWDLGCVLRGGSATSVGMREQLEEGRQQRAVATALRRGQGRVSTGKTAYARKESTQEIFIGKRLLLDFPQIANIRRGGRLDGKRNTVGAGDIRIRYENDQSSARLMKTLI